jgi:hypothetical protein
MQDRKPSDIFGDIDPNMFDELKTKECLEFLECLERCLKMLDELIIRNDRLIKWMEENENGCLKD